MGTLRARHPAPPSKIDEVYADLKAMMQDIESGRLAPGEPARLRNRILGEILRTLKLQAEYQRLRAQGKLEPMAFFRRIDRVPLTGRELGTLKRAARLQQELSRKLGKGRAKE